MTNIELKRGYGVLPDNNVRFGIRVINNSDSAILNVEVILDYSESLFVLEGSKVQKLGTIPPVVPRTAEFKLKPRGCIHKEEIGAIVIYKDHQWKRHTLEMRPKEVHCVVPFLEEKAITRADFLALSNSGYLEERGVNFEGITVAKLVDFILHTYKNRLYRVDEFTIENGKILYLAGDARGEKAYYLLTAVFKEYDGVTQVLLRAASDKSYGLNGFLNEIMDNLRHLVSSASAREIGIIKKEQVINIIDSVVQRTTFAGGEGAASVHIEGSVVQRTEIKGDEEKRRQEEERLRKQKEEQEKLRQEEAEKRRREEQKAKREEERLKREKEEQARKRQEQERLRREEEEKKAREESKTREARRGSSQKKILAVIFVLSAIALGFWAFALDSNDVPSETTPLPAHTVAPNVANTPEVSQTDSQTPTPAADTGDTFTNTIGMEFVQIPAGKFDMGSPSDEEGRASASGEGPVHHVNIENAFYMGRYEVTQKQWREVMGDNPSYFKGDDLPVEMVSWDDVQEFIKKLNDKEGTDKYRLPSEAEWEYACRAGTTTRYSFGDTESKLGDYAWYTENSGSKTHQVGQKRPNPWRLYDMYGNVREWVQDRWHGSYDGAPADGSAWGGDGANRVFRGGSWSLNAPSCRSTDRYRGGPGDCGSFLGFRLLKEE